MVIVGGCGLLQVFLGECEFLWVVAQFFLLVEANYRC